MLDITEALKSNPLSTLNPNIGLGCREDVRRIWATYPYTIRLSTNLTRTNDGVHIEDVYGVTCYARVRFWARIRICVRTFY